MEDTIAAVATAYGEGGIGIIRISGERSREILEKVFDPVSPMEPRRFTYGYVKDGEQVIDEAMAVFMQAPHTYTREDVAEIDCHGSVISLRKTLAAVLKEGARMAEPGEFTKRAFLNGRLDLSQAEAVMDLISAKTDLGFDIALGQLGGDFSLKIGALRKRMLDLLVDLTVDIDYPDEDIEELSFEKTGEALKEISDGLRTLYDTFDEGRIMREGLKVCLAGKPNVGKSSLMNALLKEDRVIVTRVPGTTRDSVEEEVNIEGIPVILTDTAGIRETEDEVERIGIEKSKAAFNEADIVMLMLDGSSPLTEEDRELLKRIKGKKCLIILNKEDLGQVVEKSRLPGTDILSVSVKDGKGIDDIREYIKDAVFRGKAVSGSSVVVTNARHGELLRLALEDIDKAAVMTANMEPPEFLEVYIRDAYERTGEILGESVNDDILNEVFSRFCLGK